ncbi:hypothetical protein EJ110_NYTH09771 [Nymphaea thermarum]|nr:hypothetical protein EJ110_NYTH09771 [Nymphaea thermarum]
MDLRMIPTEPCLAAAILPNLSIRELASIPARLLAGHLPFLLPSRFLRQPHPELSPQMAEIPRSTFQFDFDLERKILAEAEKDGQNWSSMVVENEPTSRTPETSSLTGHWDSPASSKRGSGWPKALAGGPCPACLVIRLA